MFDWRNETLLILTFFRTLKHFGKWCYRWLRKAYKEINYTKFYAASHIWEWVLHDRVLNTFIKEFTALRSSTFARFWILVNSVRLELHGMGFSRCRTCNEKDNTNLININTMKTVTIHSHRTWTSVITLFISTYRMIVTQMVSCSTFVDVWTNLNYINYSMVWIVWFGVMIFNIKNYLTPSFYINIKLFIVNTIWVKFKKKVKVKSLTCLLFLANSYPTPSIVFPW